MAVTVSAVVVEALLVDAGTSIGTTLVTMNRAVAQEVALSGRVSVFGSPRIVGS